MTHSERTRRTGSPPVSDHEFPDRDDAPLRVRAALLGFTTSERETHGHDLNHRNGADVAATLRWAERRVETLAEMHASRQLSEAEFDRATRTLDAYVALLEKDDVPPTRKPWYQIEPGPCSRCRWFEARILAVDAELTDACTCDAPPDRTIDGEPHVAGCGTEPPRARYLVLTYGRSRVPGETDKRRAAWTDSAFEVVELLVQRDRSRGRQPFLPAASARVLAQAAEHDEDIREAFVNRAVA